MTRMPLRIGICDTTPPVGCWIVLTLGLDHQIARHDDGARKRQQHHQAEREPARRSAAPAARCCNSCSVGTAGPQHDALARRAGSITAEPSRLSEECNAFGHALAGFIDHPPGGTFGHDGAGRNRRGDQAGASIRSGCRMSSDGATSVRASVRAFPPPWTRALTLALTWAWVRAPACLSAMDRRAR